MPARADDAADLNAVRRAMSGATAEDRAAIAYWDAGAPNYRWHELMFDYFTSSSAPVVSERVSAALHIAIHDAVASADHHAQRFRAKSPARIDSALRPLADDVAFSYPSIDAAAAGAASTVLAYFFPGKAADITAQAQRAARSRVAAGVAFPSDVDAGVALGREIGKRVVERLRRDGSDAEWKGSVPSEAGKWSGANPLMPGIATWKTWLLPSPSAVRPPAPPSFDDAAMNEVRDPQNLTGSRRRATFQWAITGLLRYFNEQASLRIFEDKLDRDPVRSAAIYATLNAAYYDALVAVWDAKYRYWGQRPFQYDPNFKSQITTPHFPGYPSGHAIFAGTASAILSHYFPRDARRFETVATEIANSRLWGGVHFRVDNDAGLEMGRKIGALAIARARGTKRESP